MLSTIIGTYENGQITFDEQPPVRSKSKVMITFIDEPQIAIPVNNRILGSLKGKVNIPDDFNEPLDDLNEYM